MADDVLKTSLNLSPCTIGELTVDLLLSEEEDLTNKVTQFPVESGSPAADHVVNEPGVLTLTCFVTNAPLRSHPGTIDSKARVTRGENEQLTGKDINFAELALDYLRRLRLTREAVSVTTKRGTWEKMLVQKISRTKSKQTGDALVFTITLVEFKEVKLLFVAAPRKRTGSDRSQPRAQSGKKDSPKAKDEYASVEYNLIDGISKTFFGKSLK